MNPRHPENQKDEYQPLLITIPINFGKWFLAMMNFVAISLVVSLEMVKVAQGLFIEQDYLMYDEEKDQSAKA